MYYIVAEPRQRRRRGVHFVRKSSTRLIKFECGGSNSPIPFTRVCRITGIALLKVRKPWWPWSWPMPEALTPSGSAT